MEDPDSASLEANMEDDITALLGPMGRLLRRLRLFEVSYHSLPEGLSANEIRLLQEGIDELYTYIKDAPETKDSNFTPKWWIKEVRELGYDTEDYFDEVTQSGVTAGADASVGVRSSVRLSTIFRITSKRKRRTQTRKDFSKLMARVDDARERCKSFQLALETIRPDSGQAGVSCLTPKPALELLVSAEPVSVHEQVGVEEPMNKLVELLALDEEKKNLKVTPIFGLAGVGKTTVARTLYYKYGGKFQCGAFVRVSRNPDIRRILTSTLSQIKAPHAHAFSDAQNLIDSIIKHLLGKRYFIIIDDLWTESVWDIIRRAFPYGDCSSRIITTTQIEDVALACCGYQSEYIFPMRPLSYSESRKLFFSRVFGSEGEGGCPKDFEEVTDGVIRKCGGLPLSIINVASLLQTKPNLVMEQWENVQRSLPSTLRANPTSERIKDVLILIYNKLPLRLKTCLLYLSMYPEGCTVRKDDLVKQWVVEGFVGDTEHVARGYFDELVRRGMIQPVDTEYSGEVLSCTVNHMVLDLIRYKSMEDNFIITVDYFDSTTGHPDKVRRLSVQLGGAKSAKIPESMRVSRVRSLLFCGFFKCVPSIVDYRLLRVLILHIWADQDNSSFDLTRIGELFRLRYLKIECNIIVDLPDKIQGLQYLGTMQVDAKLSAVPSDIGHLEKLLHLRLPSEASLPHGIGHITSLRTLGYFDLSSNSEDNVMDLGKLTDLQDLQLTSSTVQPAGNLENNMKCLGSVLGRISNLKSVILIPADSPPVNTPDDSGTSIMSISCDGLSSVSPAPAHLQRLELSRRCCIFPSIPKWFGGLSKLCILKIAVRELSREDINILKRLPALTALSLYVWTALGGRIIFDEGFPVLKYFKFMRTAPYIYFVKGAMPNVRKIKLGFSANRMERHRPVTFGFRHLTGLREISVKFWGAGADEPDKMAAYLSDMEAAAKHPINVKFVDRTFFGGQDDKSSVKNETISGSCTQPESSSHQNRVAEHETVARAMEGGMVSASTGAMDSVLRKLTVLIADDYPKLRGKQEEVMFLKKELDAMNAVLEHLAVMAGPNMEMKRMRNQMKEITYEVEDWIDDLMLQFDKWGALQDFIDQIRNLTAQAGKADLPSIVQTTETQELRSSYKAPMAGFIDQIRNLTAQARKADLPSTVHTSEIQTLLPSYEATGSGLHTLYNKAIGLVGIDGSRDQLVKRMNARKRKRHLVACILGSGGLGKTTLATEVCNQLRGPFDRRLFIQVPRKMDITRLHKVMLRQLGQQLHERYYEDNMDLANMDLASQIDLVRRYLRDKRYLVVMDGVWSPETWEFVKFILPENDHRSRILMTTDDRDIAESCKKHSSGFIYRMELLNALDSLSLFGGILFGFERRLPRELKKVAEKIVAACGGIPMAIIIMAGILASKPTEAAEWEMVEKRMEPVAGDGDVSKEIIRKMFHISYSSLPRDIKSCLLYLSVFPENQFIRKDHLVWRWIAEGFVPKTSGESSWETGERYFLELIVRNLIEPVYEEWGNDYEVPVGCKVHGLILEFITSLSNEENLVTTMPEATEVRHHVIRRLSASYMNQEEEDHIWRLISTQRLSKVRSITILGRDQRVDAPSRAMGASSLLAWRPLLLGSRFLRVLDLEGAKSLRDHHVEGTIEGLVLLRYLGLAGTGIYRLPEEIGKVEQLETLDLRRTVLETLPASIANLRKLVRLLVDPIVRLPSKISKMQELEQVSTIDARSVSSLSLVAELLVKSKPLRMLDVYLYKSLWEATETWRESIMSFLRVVGNSNLQSLSLCCAHLAFDHYMLGILLDSWEVPPRHLRRFKLAIHIPGVIPPRMASLVRVTHLDITIYGLDEGDVRVLGDLPNLVLLKLTAESSSDRCVISGEKAFQCLKVFTLRCLRVGLSQGGMGLEFTTAAMPQLQRLRLSFSARETLSLCGGFDFGIQHLSCLARLHATIDCKDATVEEVEGAEAAIRRQVSYFPIKPTIEFNREFESRMREDEGTMKTMKTRW